MHRAASIFRLFLLAASLLPAGRARAADVLVLMSGPGKVERYDMASGAHVGTFLSGLPPSNVLLFDDRLPQILRQFVGELQPIRNGRSLRPSRAAPSPAMGLAGFGPLFVKRQPVHELIH